MAVHEQFFFHWQFQGTILHLHFYHSQKLDPLPFFSHPLFSTVGIKHSNGWNVKKTCVWVCVCVSLYVSISRVKKNPKHRKVQKSQNCVKTSLSFSLAIPLFFSQSPKLLDDGKWTNKQAKGSILPHKPKFCNSSLVAVPEPQTLILENLIAPKPFLKYLPSLGKGFDRPF